MNIFESLKVYGEWTVTNSRNFTAEEANMVTKAVVVESQNGYGNSLCLHLKSGGHTFIPMSTTAKKGIGEEVNLSDSATKLITLSKTGEADIYRVEA